MTVSLDNRPWGIGHAAGAVLAGLVASLLASMLMGPELSDQELFRVIIPVSALAEIALIAWWASQSVRRRISLGLRFEGSDLMGIPIGVGIQIAASIALFPIIYWFFDGKAPTQEIVESATDLSGFDIVMVVIGAGLLAPISEELVFRGVLLRALFSIWLARLL